MILKKKALFFAQSGVGGAERMTASVATALETSRYEVVFYLLGEFIGDSDITDFIPETYRVERLRRRNPVGVVWQFYKILRKENPDVVFCSVQYMNRKLLFLSQLFPKCRFIIRNANYLYTHTLLQKFLMTLSYPFADVIITQTEEMREELIKGLRLQSKDKVLVLHNPVSTKLIDEKLKCKSPIEHDKSKVRYVAVGRFHRVKGFDLLVKAFVIVLQRQPNAELHILGRTDEDCSDFYNEIKHIAEENAIEDKVFCPGYTNNPYAYESKCDCFVLSSRNEGLPNVLIEALYIGLPAAAYNCIPMIERIVEEGKTGYLAEKENVVSLANAMVKASVLGRIKTTYKSEGIEDFTKLFEER